VTGRAEQVSRAVDVAHLDSLGLEVWVPHERSQWFRIRPETASGRRIHWA
jgi:hypothetical protein